MNKDQQIRIQLVNLLKQGNAFRPLSQLFETIPYEITGEKAEGFSHTVWELAEHIRLALHDLVEYSKDSHFQSPPWPEGYWPEKPEPRSKTEWHETITQIRKAMDEMIELVEDPSNDLFEPFAANKDHNLLRQATIAAEHTAYHGGQIAMLSKALERRMR